MYPPARRARASPYVLFGSVFGAILGPAVFGPLFAGREVDAATLTVPWLVAAGISLVPLLLLFCRSMPRSEAGSPSCWRSTKGPPPSAAPLREILGRPGVRPAMVAALASFGVMGLGDEPVRLRSWSSTTITPSPTSFPVICAHVLGMYALVLFVGALIDKIGRGPALGGGLCVMAVSTIGADVLRQRVRLRGCCCSGSGSAGI